MKNEIVSTEKGPSPILLILLIIEMAALPAWCASPQVDSWFISESGKYARIYQTTEDRQSGNAVTTWSRNTSAQELPAYNGVQEIDSSADWVYVHSSGLGIHVMGPWYLDPWKTRLFPNLPVNTKTIYRIPLHPVEAKVKKLTGLGPIGCFVDGVAMYDGRDSFSWNGTSEVGGPRGGYWNRDAYVNEKPSFDPANAHQDQSGTYHYHANPPALRYLLHDNVLYNQTSGSYSENTAPTELRHSPILGWVRDGYPIYGPYGYANPMDPNSGVRRMTSGYVLRDGRNGTDNLRETGRTTLPAWAARVYQTSASQPGPNVNNWYPLGRYMEDHAYLGDLGKKQGTDFDLDECNGRFCVTPEFPNGTYAYFVAIEADGTPVFPYNIGRAFHGEPAGGRVPQVTEAVTTNFLGGPNAPAASTPTVERGNGTVTLVWNSVEGGKYEVASSAEAANWTMRAADVSSQGLKTQTKVAEDGSKDYRVVRTSLAEYDPVKGGGGGIVSITPNSAARGESVTVTINLSGNTDPPLPPQQAPINFVKIGGITASNLRHINRRQAQATITIPADAGLGAQEVTLEFPGPPFEPERTVSYTLAGGFTIH
jgi:YHYH protein